MKKYLSALAIVAGIISGLVGNYSASTPSTSKLLPPGYAFAIWAVIYFTGIYLAFQLLRGRISADELGLNLISLGYLLSGLWIRFDGHQVVVAVIAVGTLASNVSAIYFLHKSALSPRLVNLLATFAGWITIATSLVIADATHISSSSDLKVAVYLGISLLVALSIYFIFAPVIGYIGTVAWASSSLLFTKSTLGTPGFTVAATGFLVSAALMARALVGARLTTSRLS